MTSTHTLLTLAVQKKWKSMLPTYHTWNPGQLLTRQVTIELQSSWSRARNSAGLHAVVQGAPEVPLSALPLFDYLHPRPDTRFTDSGWAGGLNMSWYNLLPVHSLFCHLLA